jgi:hypothetical protein
MSVPVIFDIETGPLPMDVIRKIVPPFEPPKHPGEFDERNVKLGNATKPETVAKKIEDARLKHRDALERYSLDVEQAEEQYWADVEAKAALDAMTGEVLAIGYRGEKVVIDFQGERSEAMLLNKFWNQYKNLRSSSRRMVGWNIAGFDIPFLVKRSWIVGVVVPDCVFSGPQRYLDQTFIDLMKIWSAGQWNAFTKLDTACRCLGVPGKPDGINGGDFARLFRNPETRHLALDYLGNDLEMTFGVAERVGVC